MKRMKKLASLLLAMVMVLSMTVAAFADNLSNVNTDTSTHKITIKNEKPNHNYEAYQVFSGDWYNFDQDKLNNQTNNGGDRLSNITWGSGVNGESLLNDLTTISDTNNPLKDKFDECTTAEDVARVLAGNEFKEASMMDAFAKIVADHLKTNESDKVVTNYDWTKETGKPPKGTGNDSKYYLYEISGLEDGYYLVKDKDAPAEGNDFLDGADARTRYIMQVVKDITVQTKAETPTIEKKIAEGNNWVDANTASIGQTVTYQIQGDAPDTTGYKEYYYVISDTLSSGLTLNTTTVIEHGATKTIPDMTVKLNDDILTRGTDYQIYTSADNVENGYNIGNYTFQIAFLNMTDAKYKPTVDSTTGQSTAKKITVNYSATVNANAVIGNNGNPNEAKLTYSNNPNFTSNGDNEPKPGIPSDNVPKGETPNDITITYVAQIEITKKAGTSADDVNARVLPGAEFTLTGKSYQTVLNNKDYYKADDNGNYWLLKDGTYTQTAPTLEDVEDNDGNVTKKADKDLYVSTKVKYSKTNKTTEVKILTDVKMIAESDANGKISFKGLGAGTYKIEETGVPAGYNKAEDMWVVIGCTVPENAITDKNTNASWTKTGTGEDNHTTSDGVVLNGETDGSSTQGSYEMTIVNVSGALLPSTGGIGRTIFYAAGIILMAGAMFFVVRRKRV